MTKRHPAIRPAFRVALALAVGLCWSAARAQTDPPESAGTLAAFACAPLPAAPRLAVEAQEDSPAFRHLKEVFVAGLRRQQATIGETARLRASLYVEAERENNASLPARPAHPVREITPATRRAFFEIWSNRRDSILGGRRPRSLSVDEVRVSILVHDSTNGQCIWQGEAIHPIGDRDEMDVAERLVTALIRHLGQSVKATSVTLR